MSEHTFTYDRGIAVASWDYPLVEFHFDLLRIDRRTGESSAEVTTLVQNGHPGPDMVHRARLNLVSTRARADYAKHLESRVPDLDWPGFLEEAAWQVVEAQRRGRPAMLLRDAVEPEGASWALNPLLLARDPVVLFGDGGTAKSYLALALARAIHIKEPIATLTPSRPMRTALCDFEWQEWPHSRRLRALHGPGALPDLLYVPCQTEGPLSHQVDRLRSIFHEHRIEYAVIDSVALACDGPPEEAQSALGFFQALARLEVGSALIAHVNREGDTNKPFGSAFWHNSARATWFVKRVQETGAKSLEVGLFNRKINDGAFAPPIGLRFEFSDLRTTIKGVDVRDVPDLASNVPLRSRIAHALGKDSMTYIELAEMLEVPINSVTQTVKRWEGRTFRKITATQDGVHRVALMGGDTVT